MTRLDIGAASLVGQVRSANEDSILVADGLAVVADGMGGHRAGEVASAATVSAMSEIEGSRSLDDLVRSVHLANRRISEQAAADPDLRGMGTTVCVVGLVWRDGVDELAVLNVGDSRVYLLAEGDLRLLTEDHSLVESLVREGRLTPEEARTHPQKNVLTRALGVEPLVVVDAWLLRPADGDRLLLCSDGLTNELDDERIAEILAEGDTPDVTARRLAAEADAAGGRDNTSAIVLDVVDSGSLPAPAGDRFRRITTPAVDLSEADHGPHTERVMAVVASGTNSNGSAADDDEEEAEAEKKDEEEDERTADDEEDESTVGLNEEDEGRAGDDRAEVDDHTVDREGPDPGAPPEDDPDLEGDDLRDASDEQLAAAQAEAEAAVARAARWRTAAFLLAILGVISLAVGSTVYTADRGWYVAESDNGHVALFRGTPVLWLKPGEVYQAPQLVDDLNEYNQATVRAGRSFANESEARQMIANLTPTTTTTTTTTTTSTTTTTTPTTTAAAAPGTVTTPPGGPPQGP